MKKNLLLPAFLFVSMFVNASVVKHNNVNAEKNSVVKIETVGANLETEELESPFCFTRTSKWYVESYMGMDGEVYDVYEVETTTTCY
ncbi:hypothetical protein SGQ83_15485 [Flavobacterium sp. Fl-318]|uniref:Uncharacterized protein n=1 Tax=Flavobacterium cupriresistens TaxID=2893885 RepID=A0ABU4RDU8_9FLAO|nr:MULTISPECIES: hypothetical protein [unclassified Flavobacterium]MDX6190761.1 hypothetical protein [Flavobacterium sp. Fl-318]UFH44065.1 hypothetical protein LNP23_07540 [Flavobacterium sp. F-323]